VDLEAAQGSARIRLESVQNGLVLHVSGNWTKSDARELETETAKAVKAAGTPAYAVFDFSGLSTLDTIGALLIVRTEQALKEKSAKTEWVNLDANNGKLLERAKDFQTVEPARVKKGPALLRPFAALGTALFAMRDDLFGLMAVLGRILIAVLMVATFRTRLRYHAFVNQFELIVLRAIPIVALISIVVGAIITQQSILQLRNFGVAIYVVDLSAILMLREVGLLLAAIMIAGRSGSAITAEIGSMRMREELDALNVMGVDPYVALVMPRILALLVGMPLLAFIGAASGLAGTAIVSVIYGEIPLSIFLDRLQAALTLQSLMVGMIKAPFMALIIGLVAINEGFKVKGSAESLGRRTTASVVRAIFLVIVADGVFAMFFAAIGF